MYQPELLFHKILRLRQYLIDSHFFYQRHFKGFSKAPSLPHLLGHVPITGSLRLSHLRGSSHLLKQHFFANFSSLILSLHRFADDLYSSEDFLLQAEVWLLHLVLLFNFYWQTHFIGSFELNNRRKRSAEPGVLQGRAQALHWGVSLPWLLLSCQLFGGRSGHLEVP